jgi:hypothetical protein
MNIRIGNNVDDHSKRWWSVSVTGMAGEAKDRFGELF